MRWHRLRPRFTVRRMMAAVVVTAVGTWIVIEAIRPRPLAGQRFALIGPIDVDRDGRDDRNLIGRAIRKAGGSIDFDLPASGASSGEIGPATSWYVIGEPNSRNGRRAAEGAAIARARAEGVRPIAAGRLLDKLGVRRATAAGHSRPAG